jgi:hypothetical protein
MSQFFAFSLGIITCRESKAQFEIHDIVIEQQPGNIWRGWYGSTLLSRISDQTLPEESFDIQLSVLDTALEIKNCKRINDRVFEFKIATVWNWHTK